MVDQFIHKLESTGAWAPWLFIALFIAASFVMIWRLEVMAAGGFEGTVLGTLIMPYCTGIGNLVFTFVAGRKGVPGAEVMTNSLVNNVTNMTLLLGAPAIIWGLTLVRRSKTQSKPKSNSVNNHKTLASNTLAQKNRLDLLLTLIAVLFFTSAVWELGRDGRLDFNDGVVLVALFLFWQAYHLFDVLKSNIHKNQSFDWYVLVELLLLILCGYVSYLATDWLVDWVGKSPQPFIHAHLGLLSGWLMVIPNGLLAFYHGWRGRAEIVYTSQVGDGHICIPLCVGLYALYHTFTLPAVFNIGMAILIGAAILHGLCIMIFGGLPRFVGLILVAAYAYFLYLGILS